MINILINFVYLVIIFLYIFIFIYLYFIIKTISWIIWVFDLDARLFLSFELLFCLMYINSKRNPDLVMNVWGFQVKSKIYLINNK
jgi:hypothetical protein